MTRTPDFDELVGVDIERDERDRLLRMHAVLLEAGPPAELPITWTDSSPRWSSRPARSRAWFSIAYPAVGQDEG